MNFLTNLSAFIRVKVNFSSTQKKTSQFLTLADVLCVCVCADIYCTFVCLSAR